MLVRDWLICGPLLNPLPDFAGALDPTAPAYGRSGRWSISNAPDANALKTRVARRLPVLSPIDIGAPRESSVVRVRAATADWRQYSTPEDGLVDFTLFVFTPQRLTGLAATVIVAPRSARYRVCLEANSPVTVWVDGRRVARHTGFSYMDPRPHPFTVRLTAGRHEVVLIGEHVGFRESRLIFGLHIDEALQTAQHSTAPAAATDPSLAGGAARRAGPRSERPYGTYDGRRSDALEFASATERGISRALAGLALGRTQQVDAADLEHAVTAIEERHDCADFEALGLLTLLSRPTWASAIPGRLQRRVESALLGFKYWLAEPGLDGMCYHTENHQLVFHVAELLAGQLYPEHVFSNVGRPGTWHAARGEQRVRRWMGDRLRGGFSEWDSNAYVAIDVFALLAVSEYARSAGLRRMATALLDVIFFQLAVNSWRGIHGCSHGRTYAPALVDAALEATSGMQRLAWGLGSFNDEDRATVLLATSSTYRVPSAIQRVGTDSEATFTARGRSANRFRGRYDLSSKPWSVNTLVYRAPHGMLACAQDYRRGQPGLQEHVWQATLGPRAVVFATHPANSSRSPSARPNYWAGNAILPRAVQHEHTLIALYQPSANQRLPFTHAYFPTREFDEWHLVDGWAFARHGEGYVALGSESALALGEDGRELRPSDLGRVWVCRLGGRASDGTFADFMARLRASRVELSAAAGVRWTADDRVLELPNSGPLLVDGVAQPAGPYPRFDSPYAHAELGDPRLLITSGEDRLELDLEHGARR